MTDDPQAMTDKGPRTAEGHACDWPGCAGQCHTGETCPCHPAAEGPRTAEGAALLEWLDGIGDSPLSGVSFPDADDRIIAIEDAAFAQGVAAARAAVEAERDISPSGGDHRPVWDDDVPTGWCKCGKPWSKCQTGS